MASDNVEQEVMRLKQQPGKDLALFGSADLASSLMRYGLIDEYRILVSPVLLGSGMPMFKDVRERILRSELPLLPPRNRVERR